MPRQATSLLVQVAACAFLALSCANRASVLDCDFDGYTTLPSTEATPAADVSFSADWGTAPSQMRVQVFTSQPDRVYIRGCGRDQDEAEWEMRASWWNLPAAYPLNIDFFDRARLEAGERPVEGAPDFSGALLRCTAPGCVAVDKVAYYYDQRAAQLDNVTGSTHLEHYDSATGRLVASIDADPGEPNDRPRTTISLNLSWNPDYASEPAGAAGYASDAAGANPADSENGRGGRP